MAPLSNAERQARHRRRQAYEQALLTKQISEIASWVNELQAEAGLEVRQLPELASLEESPEKPVAEIVNRQAANTVVELHRAVVLALNRLVEDGDADAAKAILRQIDRRFATFRREALVISRD